MLSAKEFMNVSNEISYQKWRMDNELYPYGGELEGDALPYKGNPYSPEEIAAAGEGTDWFGAAYARRLHQPTQRICFSRYGIHTILASLNYYKQKGVINEFRFPTVYPGKNKPRSRFREIRQSWYNATYSTIFNNNVPLGEGNAENSSLLNSALPLRPPRPG